MLKTLHACLLLGRDFHTITAVVCIIKIRSSIATAY